LPLPLQAPSPLEKEEALLGELLLGTAAIIFEQFKQVMLTLFYFVWTVSGALIAAED
jgi:hypothetical protein